MAASVTGIGLYTLKILPAQPSLMALYIPSLAMAQRFPTGILTYAMPLVPSLIVNVPTGGGGGCIHDGRIHNGALVNMSVNLGPVSSNGFLPGYIGGGTGLDYNPRCLVRDIGPAISRSGLAYQNVIDLLAPSADCTAFVNNLDTGMNACEWA